jgi:hypothetical protein
LLSLTYKAFYFILNDVSTLNESWGLFYSK